MLRTSDMEHGTYLVNCSSERMAVVSGPLKDIPRAAVSYLSEHPRTKQLCVLLVGVGRSGETLITLSPAFMGELRAKVRKG